MESLAPCGRVKFSKESPGEAVSEGTAQLQKSSAVWRCQSQPAHRRQSVCVVGGRAREVQMTKPFGAQKVLSESQTCDPKFYTLREGACTDTCKRECVHAREGMCYLRGSCTNMECVLLWEGVDTAMLGCVLLWDEPVRLWIVLARFLTTGFRFLSEVPLDLYNFLSRWRIKAWLFLEP